MRKYKTKKLKQSEYLPKGSKYIEVEKEIKPLETELETGIVLNTDKFTHLVKTGETRDIQEEINSYKEQADINAIIKKVETTGDTTLLSKKLGVYEDISQAPETLHDAYKQAAELQTRIAEAQKILADLQAKEPNENGNGSNSRVGSVDSSSNNTNNGSD